MTLLSALGLILCSLNAQASVTSFATDGCTHFANGTHAQPTLWKQCCVLHDLAYWAGGNVEALDEVDLNLRECVASTGPRTIAEIMYWGIRLGHLSSHAIRGEQWGNAWSETERRTTKLSVDEIDQLQNELTQPNYDSVLEIGVRNAFIQQLRNTN